VGVINVRELDAYQILGFFCDDRVPATRARREPRACEGARGRVVLPAEVQDRVDGRRRPSGLELLVRAVETGLTEQALVQGLAPSEEPHLAGPTEARSGRSRPGGGGRRC